MLSKQVWCIAVLLCVGLAAVRAEETDDEIAADFAVTESSFVETDATSEASNWNELSEEGTLELSSEDQNEIIADALEMLEVDFINNYGTHEDRSQLSAVLAEERRHTPDGGDEPRFAERRRHHRSGGGGGGGGGWRGAMSNWAAQNARRAQQAGNSSPAALSAQSSLPAAQRAGQGFFRRLGAGIRRFGARAGQWLRDRFGGGQPPRPQSAVVGGGGGGGRWWTPTHTVRCRDGTFSSAGGHRGACSHHGGIASSPPPTTPPTPTTPPVKATPPPPPPPPQPKQRKRGGGWLGRLFNKIQAGARSAGKAFGAAGLKKFARKLGEWGSKKLKEFLSGHKPGTVVVIPPKNGVGRGTKVIVPAVPGKPPLPAPKGALAGMPVPKTAKQLAEEAREARRKARRQRREKLRAERNAARQKQKEKDAEDLKKWLEDKQKKIDENEEKRLSSQRQRKDYSGLKADLPDSQFKPHSAAECEDCVACRYVWKQVEMDVGNTQIEENVYDSFTANALEAQKTPIFYPGIQSMFDQIDDMLGDYMKGMRVDHMCENAMMCRP